MIKKSRQREAILQCLVNRYDHPTAETVYLSIKDDFPNISLGTVYRNLSLLSDLGEISKNYGESGPGQVRWKSCSPLSFLLQGMWLCDGS